MNDPFAADNNPNTFSTASVQTFEVEAGPVPPSALATQRPTNRPRQVADGPLDVSFQSFDVEATPMPPGAKPTPRPLGQERPKLEDLETPPEQIQLAPNYTALIQRDNGYWIGWIEQLAAVNEQEKTREELLDRLRHALHQALHGE